MPARFEDLPVICKGGLVLNVDNFTLGTELTGAAKILKNYEPSIEGGYRRIDGYSKFDEDEISGTGPVLGVVYGLGGVVAVRENSGSTSFDVHFSSGTGWTKINSANRANTVTKARGLNYNIGSGEAVVIVDGANPALKYDGSTDVLLNSPGAPSDPKYVSEFVNRLVFAGYSSNEFAITLSSPGDDTDYSAVNGAVEINVGDKIVGLKVFRQTLYIFCENSIKKLVGNTSANFAIEDVTISLGCLSGDSIQEVGGDLIFLGPDGLRSLAATERIGDLELGLQSQAIQPKIRDIVGSFTSNSFSSCVVRSKSQYRLFIYEEGLEDDVAQGFIGYRTAVSSGSLGYEWSETQGINAYCADSSYQGDDEFIVHGSPSSGFVYRQERGTSFDGSNIPYVYRTPDLTFNNYKFRKQLREIEIYTQVEGDIDVTASAILNFEEETVLQPPSFKLEQTGSVSIYGTAVYDTDSYSVISFPTFKKNQVGSGFTIAFQFSGQDTNPSHRIDSFTITFSPRGRK